MRQKEVTEKRLEEHNDVFADIINVLLFNGERIVSEDSLIEAEVKSQYMEETGRLHEMERNVARYWKEKNIFFVINRLGSQTPEAEKMPVSAISYNNIFYRQNHHAEDNKKYIIPVVTLILYYGLEEWSSPCELKINARVPESLKPCFQVYKADIFPVAFLDERTVQMFQSDFYMIADFLAQKRMKKAYVPGSRKIGHVDEVLELLRGITGDDRYQVEFSEKEKGRKI